MLTINFTLLLYTQNTTIWTCQSLLQLARTPNVIIILWGWWHFIYCNKFSSKIHNLQKNESVIFNHHNTYCHWPHTLEWGCFVLPQIPIHRHTKLLSFYPKLTLNLPTLLYEELHSSFMTISCFSPKQNTPLSKMISWRKPSKVSSGRTCFN